jgi:nicotinamide mononucleotide transporter
VSELEIVAALVGALSVYLSTRQHLWSWPTAIVNVLLYAYIFHGAKLYADMGLQVVYAGLSCYGWYEWQYGGARRTPLPVTRTPARHWPLLVALVVAGSLVLGWTMTRFTDAAIPYVDSALTAVSLLAQWMMTRKLLEHWLVWIAVDLVYVPVYVSRQLPATAVLYAVFLVLAVMGYVSWRRDWRAAQGELPARAAA